MKLRLGKKPDIVALRLNLQEFAALLWLAQLPKQRPLMKAEAVVPK